MFWMYFVIYFIFIGAQLNEYLHFCRKRNEEMKIDPDAKEKDDDWEDDDIPDIDDDLDLDAYDEEFDKELDAEYEKLKAEKSGKIIDYDKVIHNLRNKPVKHKTKERKDSSG